MKIILWVEDATDDIYKVFDDDDDLPHDVTDEVINNYLVNKYHIHRVTNLSDALTAVGERDYDYYLLDVNFPENKKKDIKSQKIIDDFVEHDRNENNFNEMKAGQYLFMHLLPKTDIDQIRIYSGHVKHTEYLKDWAMSSELSLNWDEITFSKSIDSTASAKEVKEWLKGIPSDERILRHAMMNMCNDMIDNKNMRTIYTLTFEKIEQDKLVKHVNMLKTMVDNGTVLLEDEKTIKIYNQILLLIITSECQEQASFTTRKNNEDHPQIGQKKLYLKEDFKRLSNVLRRVRNMIAHNANAQGIFTTKFVAFVFLIYVRYMCILNEKTAMLEKNILNLFDGDQPSDLSCCYEQLNKAVQERSDIIGNDWKYSRDYKGLFGKSFEAYSYEGNECIRIFLLNFIDYDRNYRKPSYLDGIELKWNQKNSTYIDDHKKETREFTDSWFDDYFKAFYTVAFPEPNE